MHNYESIQWFAPPGHRAAVFGTWAIFFLPYLEQHPLYDAYNQQRQVLSRRVRRRRPLRGGSGPVNAIRSAAPPI